MNMFDFVGKTVLIQKNSEEDPVEAKLLGVEPFGVLAGDLRIVFYPFASIKYIILK